ncbi:MAG: ParB/RepB/Spo0J family partition protein [Elusimicrobiota bacterium]
MKRKALGKGLDALLPKVGTSMGGNGSHGDLRKVSVDSIRPNRLQPRKNFDPERLSELAQSIKEHGLAQPIVASYDSISNSYELIAGERRLQASKLAGLTHIDAVIRMPKSDKERLSIALAENIQRDNLNAIETAKAYKQLMTEFGVTQANLSQELGKSKPTISNTLRLLELPDDIQKAVQFEQLSEGHARALLMVKDALERDRLFKLALEQHLSVRAVEGLAKQIEEGKHLADASAPAVKMKPIKSADILTIEKKIEHALGTRVEIKTKKDEKSGRIVIHFYSLNDFDKILNILK